MIQNEKKYVYGTAAEKLEYAEKVQYNVYEENKVLKRKKLQRSNRKEKLKVVLYMLAIFSMCIFIMYRYALITELNYRLNKQVLQYEDQLKRNQAMAIKINQAMDLQKIKEAAQARLGMHKPDKYQLVYLKVPKNDKVKVADQYKDSNSSNGFIASITGTLGKLKNFLE